MTNPGSFFLVGPMGAGKSTIGRQLARALNLEFIDSDREIEVRTGVDIPLIFELEGESGFRKREHQAIDLLTARKGIVRRCLSSRGKVIYLHASVEQQLQRTAHDRSRPLLQTENPRQKLEELMQIRDPLYREIADWVVETDSRRVRDVVKEIVQHIESD